MKSDGQPDASDASDAREAERRALLRAHPWGRTLAQLTLIALKRMRGRSAADAEDFAQSAIADAYTSVARGGWDPERGPLVPYLVARVITTAGGERRRKRNRCEVWLDEEVEEDGEEQGASAYEKHLAEDTPTPEVALDCLRFASTFHDWLLQRLAGDPPALELVPLMKEGLFKPADLTVATGKPVAQVKEALRRVRYHAQEITKELSAQASPMALAGPRSNEVTQ